MSQLSIKLVLLAIVIMGGALLSAADQAWLRKYMRIDLFEPDERLVAWHYLTVRVTGAALLLLALAAGWRLAAGLLR